MVVDQAHTLAILAASEADCSAGTRVVPCVGTLVYGGASYTSPVSDSFSSITAWCGLVWRAGICVM